MASLAQVDAALHGLVEKLARVDAETRARLVVDRTVSCAVDDLAVVYSARVSDAGISDVTTQPRDPAQVRLRVRSDDLVALVEGRLAVPAAWASGRLRVEASVLDLLKLRALL